MSEGFDAILARSRAPGRFVERRSFTLSRDRAVEKLREFTLRHPEQYILELVQAAVFAGARWIAIDVSADRLFFAWVGGRPFTSAQLSGVFDFLFADRAAAETRHVVQLAVSLNALLQRSPKLLRIESGDGSSEGSVRMDLDAKGKGHVGRPENAFAGTYLVAEFATSWFARFSGQDWTREQALVEERCAYSPVPILLNYRAPFGYRANREVKLYGVTAQQPFSDDEGRRGVLALPPKVDKDQGIRFVVGGVWISTRLVPLLGEIRRSGLPPLPLVGVIADDRLRKTADQGDVVEDARWIDMLHAVQPVGTEVIRSYLHGSAYEPPPLPRRVAEPATVDAAAGPRGPTPEPLPDALPQVAPRPSLALTQLVELGARAPVFWADPDTAAALGAAGGPERFPFCLLILSAGQALTLGRSVPALSLAPLTSAADAEFVSRIFARQARHRAVRVPLTAADGLGSAGQMELRLHLQGQPPAWAGGAGGEVPVTVRGRGSSWCGTLELGLPGVSVQVALDGDTWDEATGPAALTWLLRLHAWRLVEGLTPVARARDVEPAQRSFVLALLAMQCRPRSFVDDAGPALTVSMPRRWGATATAILRTPLIDTDRGALCLDDLVDLLGRPHDADDAQATALRPDDLDAVEPLMRRFGVGHLVAPARHGRPLLAVADRAMAFSSQWVRQAPTDAPGVQPRALLWVGEDLRPAVSDPRWRLVSHPVAGVGYALRADPPAVADRVDVAAGLALLQQQLGPVVREDRWRQLLPRGADVARARRMGRLALVALAADARDLDARVLPASDGSAWLPLRRLSPTPADADDGPLPAVRIALRGGPRVAEPDTALLTWDELSVLRRAGLPTPLRFDDPPDVWHSLADPEPAADRGDWLLRERLAIPGLDGWLGLRHPYDPTSAVLLQDSGELAALTDIDRHVPCHGLVWPQGAGAKLSHVQHDLLELARLRLYQRLATHIEGTQPLPTHPAGSDDWRAVATCYALDYAVHAWQQSPTGDPDGTAGRLLDSLRLRIVEGEGGGEVTLRSWLALEPGQRPLPQGHAARYRGAVATSGKTDPTGDYEAHLRRFEQRLGAALAAASAAASATVSHDLDVIGAAVHLEERGPHDPPVRTWQEASGAGLLALRLNEHHPLVYAALAAPGPAREILLLEAARVAAAALRESSDGPDLDLLQLHQLLAAQRV